MLHTPRFSAVAAASALVILLGTGFSWESAPCGSFGVLPFDGNVPGGSIQLRLWNMEEGESKNVLFLLGGIEIAFFGTTNADLNRSATIPESLFPGTYNLEYEIQVAGEPTIFCSEPYNVLFSTVVIPGTIPPPTTAAAPPPTPSSPTTSGAAAPTTAVAANSTSTTASVSSTTVGKTTTTLLASTTTSSTLIAAAPPVDDGFGNGVMIGLLIGLGIAAMGLMGWALGRRVRATAGQYQPPPPPPA